MEIPSRLVVHSGSFHADDVLCAAMLRHANPNLEIVRAHDDDLARWENAPRTLVADVGGGRFDHHQPDAALRADGHKHAACGLVFEEFRDQMGASRESVEKALREADADTRESLESRLHAIEQFEQLVEDVEDADNGVVPTRGIHPVTTIVQCSNPDWDDDTPTDEAFLITVENVRTLAVEPFLGEGAGLGKDALDAAQQRLVDVSLRLEEKRDDSNMRAYGLVKSYVEASGPDIVVMDRFAPWQDVVCDTDASYVAFPSNRGGWNLQCVPVSPHSFERRKPLPRAWLDQKPEGCSFVHQARFLAAFDTREHALEAAESILDQSRHRRLPNAPQGAPDASHETEARL